MPIPANTLAMEKIPHTFESELPANDNASARERETQDRYMKAFEEDSQKLAVYREREEDLNKALAVAELYMQSPDPKPEIAHAYAVRIEDAFINFLEASEKFSFTQPERVQHALKELRRVEGQ